jgi:putative ABC transport system substrate-binding protein
VKRRQFIAGLGSAAAWPVVAHAQQPERIPVVGYLGGSPGNGDNVASFLRGLADGGYIEGRNVAIEYRWARTGWNGCRHWRPT